MVSGLYDCGIWRSLAVPVVITVHTETKQEFSQGQNVMETLKNMSKTSFLIIILYSDAPSIEIVQNLCLY